jgi:hypothetical protein
LIAAIFARATGLYFRTPSTSAFAAFVTVLALGAIAFFTIFATGFWFTIGACGHVCYNADKSGPGPCSGGQCVPVDVLTGWPIVFDIAPDEDAAGFVYYTTYSFSNVPHVGVVGRVPKGSRAIVSACDAS